MLIPVLNAVRGREITVERIIWLCVSKLKYLDSLQGTIFADFSCDCAFKSMESKPQCLKHQGS